MGGQTYGGGREKGEEGCVWGIDLGGEGDGETEVEVEEKEEGGV